MPEPITLASILKFPFVLVWRGVKYAIALFAAPGRIAKLEKQVANAQDPRPICTVCAVGRVGVFHHDPGLKSGWPTTYGICSNSDCRADWIVSHDGSKLRHLQ